MTNELREVTGFVTDAWFVSLMPNIVLMLLVNADHAQRKLFTPFSFIQKLFKRLLLIIQLFNWQENKWESSKGASC